MELKDIEHLAHLARVHLSDEEKEGIRNDFTAILSYVDQIQSVKVPAHTDVVYDLVNRIREDETPHPPSFFTEILLHEVPEREQNYVKVRQVIGE